MMLESEIARQSRNDPGSGMSNGKTILVVEDETDLLDAVCYHLQRDGYTCRRATDGAQALAEISKSIPDAIILDRMMPRMSGDEVARKLRSDPRTASIPILMLTAKSDEADELVGFAIGADDYVHKPFSVKLLSARVAATLRRKQGEARTGDVLTAGPIVLDRLRHEVTVASEPIQLTAAEFRALAALMAARGRVLDREQLLDATVGAGVAVTQRTIDVHIASLRKKLGTAAGWIQTIRGVGYALRNPPTETPAV